MGSLPCPIRGHTHALAPVREVDDGSSLLMECLTTGSRFTTPTSKPEPKG